MAFYWQVSKLVALPVVTGGGVDSEVKTMRDAIEAAGVDLKKRRPFSVMGVTSDAANGAKALGRQFAFLVGVAALTVTCDMHAVNKAEENAWLRAFGERGDMNDMNLLQLCFKGYWLFKERWDFYSAAWNRFFSARAIVLKKRQKPILTRWSYIKLVADRCRRVYQDVARVSPTESIKSTQKTLCDKYDADVAASNKRKQPEVQVDFEKLAQAAGSVSAVGGSITSVKLSKLSIDFVRGIMGRFSLAGMESVSQIKLLKKKSGLTDAKLRERLEDELRKLFSSTEESDRKLFEQLKSELQTERTREKAGAKKKAKSAD